MAETSTPENRSRRPSPSYSVTYRLEITNVPGMLGKVTSAIGAAGGDIGAIDIVEVRRGVIVRDITVSAADEAHSEEIRRALESMDGVRVVSYSDRVFLAHLGGKIETSPRMPVKTRDDLSLVYTPGVARVAEALARDPDTAFKLTVKGSTVAVVTDGSAVLGLGDLGPIPALPVMEGKALLFKTFAGVNAFPICLGVRDPAKIVEYVEAISPSFGAINLEDISAPRCFEIEEELRRRLEIPVIHDDQHATAVVVLAGLTNALRLVEKELSEARIVVCGVGAAGTATIRLLLSAGAREIIPVDREGILSSARDPWRRWVVERTNPRGVRGGLAEALKGADVFIGLSAPGVLDRSALELMAPDPIVFALANPFPEIRPEEAQPLARVVATGRSDYPNQVNNALCFPGLFKGLLDVRARGVSDGVLLAAARAIADVLRTDELHEEYIVPSIFDRRVVPSVARAVAEQAVAEGLARRRQKPAAG